MKLDSPLFNRIRVKPEQDRKPVADAPVCQWPGCEFEATHRAPKGRNREQEYWRFCLDHVREYNHSYNYFKGMSDDAVARYQKDAVTGHRPTWKMGLNGGANDIHARASHDPFDVLREFGAGPSARVRQEQQKAEARPVRNAERKAFDTLGLEIDAAAPEIKARFKELVKRHHPDANGGDRSTEDRLVAVIQAYNYLKSAKFC
jgi:curved DNA-binding protein CbpA